MLNSQQICIWALVAVICCQFAMYWMMYNKVQRPFNQFPFNTPIRNTDTNSNQNSPRSVTGNPVTDYWNQEIEIVSEMNEYLGKVETALGIHTQGLYIRNIQLFLCNNQNKIYLERRSSSSPFFKHMWQQPWTIVESGETFEDAAQRLVLQLLEDNYDEELFDDSTSWKKLMDTHLQCHTIKNEAAGVPDEMLFDFKWMQNWRLMLNSYSRLYSADSFVVEGDWFTPDEVARLVQSKDAVPWLAKEWYLFLFQLLIIFRELLEKQTKNICKPEMSQVSLPKSVVSATCSKSQRLIMDYNRRRKASENL